jgi:hypothetical protein
MAPATLSGSLNNDCCPATNLPKVEAHEQHLVRLHAELEARKTATPIGQREMADVSGTLPHTPIDGCRVSRTSPADRFRPILPGMSDASRAGRGSPKQH